ncbi:MAG: energy transducer TonB [Novosphingobium sp.]|nr:energy transducer TonB [Novosphingobium sp.]
MIRVADLTGDERHWTLAAGVALAAHLAVGALVLAWSRPGEVPVPEPVVLVDLPPAAAAASAVTAAQPQPDPQPEYVPPDVVTPPIKVPPVRAPLPKDPVVLPPPPPMPVRTAAPQPAVTAPATNALAVAPEGTGTSTSPVSGNDPKARAQAADYFSLISAHLNRKKRYPAEAKKAMQQGVVTVRFTVARDGSVSNVSIKRSSGHELLDQATMDLLRRVAPLPRIPASMKRDSITLSLPIDYSLKTN